MRSHLFALGLLLLAGTAIAAKPSPDLAAYDAILATVQPGQTTVTLGDMILPVETVRLWRDRLAGTAAPESASQTGITKWPGGNVYYAFNANVSAVHRTATLDAMAEWTGFANLTFTERVAQANYIMINDGGPGLFGGNSAVGMIGGGQQLNIGSTSWNRGTLLHELGHALGLIHEHQRSDRDTFVTIGAAVADNGNFILIPTSTNNGAYDFLSVMHYARDGFAPAGVDDITPKPGYTQFADLMGANPDRLLSRRDRDGMAIMYGAGPAQTTVVTNTKDSGPGSLRTAIYHAFDVATDTPGATPVISFQIPNTDPNFSGGVFTLRPSDRLPAPGPGTTIDATTQTAFTGDTNPSGPEIVLTGTQQTDPAADRLGLRLSAANVTVKGLVINGFATRGILITGPGATGNTVAGCYLGTNAAGTAAVANTFEGVAIYDGATGNRIGGTTAEARNVISGNSAQGVSIRDAGTNGNLIEGNSIGTNAVGTAALANGFAGVDIFSGAQGNIIGGTVVGARNILSGNSSQGAVIRDAGTSNNVILGNFIGLNAAGTAALGNSFGGVQIFDAATGNTIGGTAAGAANVLSGNPASGISVSDPGSTGNVIAGNYIGTNPAGTASIPNAYAGVSLYDGAAGNTVGGTAPGAGNLISGNTSQGVVIFGAGTNGNTVLGNFIGLNAAGTTAVKNGYAGVEIGSNAQNNLIGGSTPAARNIISGNQSQGVAINTAGTSGNRVSGNYIGTNPGGTAAIGNGFPGVEIYSSATGNTIGGSAPGEGNVISGNGYRQIAITNPGTNGNVVAGNLIGLNAAGLAALPAPVNPGQGIGIFGGAQNNLIGGTSGGRNFISGNSAQGLLITGGGTDGNLIQGNSIGLAPGGGTIGNADQGIALWMDGSGSPQGNTIGGSAPGAANSISGNATAGVAIYNAGTTGNRISANSITGNGGLGIDLWGNGITANDANDADTGPANLQNFPVLTSAVLGVGTTVSGTFNSAANTTFRIEFFASATGDASGNGEGQNFIGAVNVTTNASGNFTLSTPLSAAVPAGQKVCATATDPAGNTSEYSNHVTVTTTDSDSDGLPNAYELANWPATTTTTGDADSDGDGMTNAQEFHAGTNPRNGASLLRLEPPTTVGADKTLSLSSLTGRTYRIDFADALLGPVAWRTLADQIPGNGSPITITDPGASTLPQRFYRAVVVP